VESCILARRSKYRFILPGQLDPKTADKLVSGAIVRLRLPPGEKVLCTRRALKEALLAVIQEAYEVGLLAGQEIRRGESMRPKKCW